MADGDNMVRNDGNYRGGRDSNRFTNDYEGGGGGGNTRRFGGTGFTKNTDDMLDEPPHYQRRESQVNQRGGSRGGNRGRASQRNNKFSMQNDNGMRQGGGGFTNKVPAQTHHDRNYSPPVYGDVNTMDNLRKDAWS